VPAPAESSAAPPYTRAVRPRRILVAEDSRDAADMLRMMLEYTGHEVRVAFDGVDAVAQAAVFRPQIALLDIGMPRMDGYEAARRIRAALGASVVLVALTGWGQDDDKARARAAGFDHHLTKPADPDKLQQLVSHVGAEA
jgi:CheY-like chemotaxis protein